ncbi:hypothetical protein [Nocardioides sp. GY 10127]|uniref:hypothetical protein n=1 Tax=Nocardioides sp. GY 10127 TaxID=2569762 RepID=UPI0010A7FDA3|nr:hypothetical protein [Nocardioides sp. GY 10127]TIC81855.1 hypothetical protein E8D37_11820 [Nocardioides sp. GY 10127]
MEDQQHAERPAPDARRPASRRPRAPRSAHPVPDAPTPRATAPRGVRRAVLLAAACLVLALLPGAPTAAADGTTSGTSARTATGGLRAAAGGCRLTRKLVPRCPGGVLTGAYVHPHGHETWNAAVKRFERQSGGRLGVVHFYSRGDSLFPSRGQRHALNRGAGRRLLFANWKPDDGYTWRQVANGAADARLRAEARYLKKHWDRPMFLTVHHEPEDEVVATSGSGYQARDYRAMYRHVEDVFDEVGADQVVWVMNYMGFQGWVQKAWFKNLYPGNAYVDWIAYDPYMAADLGGYDPGGLQGLINRHWGTDWRGFYRWARRHHASKPLMLAEWGIGERPGHAGWKGRFMRRLARQLAQAPALDAMIYFDSPVAAVAGDVTIDTTASALKGFRRLRASRVLSKVVPSFG